MKSRIDTPAKNLYTEEQVRQAIREALEIALLRLTDPAAPYTAHLDNDTPQASPSYEKAAISVSEAARMIGISRPKMYELARAGYFHTVTVGRRILISKPSLLNWIAGGKPNG